MASLGVKRSLEMAQEVGERLLVDVWIGPKEEQKQTLWTVGEMLFSSVTQNTPFPDLSSLTGDPTGSCSGSSAVATQPCHEQRAGSMSADVHTRALSSPVVLGRCLKNEKRMKHHEATPLWAQGSQKRGVKA